MESAPHAAVLLVNDRRDALTSLRELLHPLGLRLACATSAAEGLQLMRHEEFALAIVDLRMPEMDGISMLERMKADPRAADVPVMLVTAADVTPEIRQRAFALGAVDIVALPASAAELHAKVGAFTRLHHKTQQLLDEAQALKQRVQGAVHKHQERFQILAETASDFAIFFTDTAGLIREWTAGAAKVFGYSTDEVIGKPIATIFTAEDRASGVPERELAEAARTGAANNERWHKRKDGQAFYAIGRMIALRDGNGLHGFANILRDATASKLADARVHEALDRFESLAESMRQMAWMADNTGARFWFNRRWLDYTGMTAEDLKGWGFLAVYAPEDRPGIEQKLREHFSAGRDWSDEWRIRGRDGNYRWFLTQVAPVKDPDGAVMRWFGTNTDIHDQVLLRQQIRASEQKFREIFETANEGIWILNADAQIEMVNQRMAEMLGYAPQDVIGRLKTDFVFPEDIGYVRRLFEQRRRGSVASVEVRFRRKDGTPVWTLMSARPLTREGDFAGALDMFTDISARKDAAKQFEDELKAQVQERTRKLQEKSQQLESFAYTIAHDLRSPLRAISGYAEFTLEDYRQQLPEGATSNLQKIRASAHRLDMLIHDLLSYTRVVQLDFEEQDVAIDASVQWALEQLQAEIERKAAVVEVPPDLPTVRGERSILDQVFLNLLSNSLKFVTPGVPPRVTVSAESRGAMVRVNITDNGIGIAPEYQDRIFRVFERLQSSHRFEGTGVGLAIVARAAERLGGRAGVDSEPGRGSTFWVELRKGTT